LIVFCGGDGTATDIFKAVGEKKAVIGIPAGVKMHSAVFAKNPSAAAKLVNEYQRKKLPLKEGEVIDVNEKAYRNGRLKTKVYGYMKVPYNPRYIQSGKAVYISENEQQAKKGIAEFAKQFMEKDTAYILGAGTTTKAVADELGIEKTLLGVDVVKAGKTIVKDANEKKLLNLVEKEENVKIMVTPIGAQGFVFGRGTQQISPQVIRKVGVKNIVYISTPHKLNSIPYLLVDTGDAKLDEKLCGYKQIVIGYQLAQRKDIKKS
jgi:predicted polyphosphate/ATP-dependent NAD kinase